MSWVIDWGLDDEILHADYWGNVYYIVRSNIFDPSHIKTPTAHCAITMT